MPECRASRRVYPSLPSSELSRSTEVPPVKPHMDTRRLLTPRHAPHISRVVQWVWLRSQTLRRGTQTAWTPRSKNKLPRSSSATTEVTASVGSSKAWVWMLAHAGQRSAKAHANVTMREWLWLIRVPGYTGRLAVHPLLVLRQAKMLKQNGVTRPARGHAPKRKPCARHSPRPSSASGRVRQQRATSGSG